MAQDADAAIRAHDVDFLRPRCADRVVGLMAGRMSLGDTLLASWQEYKASRRAMHCKLDGALSDARLANAYSTE